MMRLGEVASLIRSKNAGPFQLTFDIMFSDPDLYNAIKRSGALNRSLFAKLYQTPIERVLYVEHDRALAFKATIPRHVFSGDLGDTDVFGCQQFDPIAQIELPAMDVVKHRRSGCARVSR